jgi:glycosyltransferase involved in cell wall biosynthesis
VFDKNSLVILIAPNVSEQMGGEAIKALQIFHEIRKLHPNTIQITHRRCRPELLDRLKTTEVYFVDDTAISLIIWRSRILRPLLDLWFALKAIRLAEQIAHERRLIGNQVIVHQTEPNSPVIPRFVSPHHFNVFGPINGNIYYPKIFRWSETLQTRMRRVLHQPAQFVNRCLFHGKSRVDAVLCAGGSRTRKSLEAAGYPADVIFDSPDCGVKDDILDRQRCQQQGTNLKFVHFGRLVFHKGTVLAIESLTKTNAPICLDIIGRGPELTRCQKLTETLGLSERVRFLNWMPSHNDLIDALSQYRGVVLPTFEDANGIVIQEAMALGLPTICLDWGGPQLLIQNEISGFLIEPISRDHIISSIAARLDQLAIDAAFAERLSISARAHAGQWRWSRIAASWLAMYESLQSPLFRS